MYIFLVFLEISDFMPYFRTCSKKCGQTPQSLRMMCRPESGWPNLEMAWLPRLPGMGTPGWWWKLFYLWGGLHGITQYIIVYMNYIINIDYHVIILITVDQYNICILLHIYIINIYVILCRHIYNQYALKPLKAIFINSWHIWKLLIHQPDMFGIVAPMEKFPSFHWRRDVRSLQFIQNIVLFIGTDLIWSDVFLLVFCPIWMFALDT